MRTRVAKGGAKVLRAIAALLGRGRGRSFLWNPARLEHFYRLARENRREIQLGLIYLDLVRFSQVEQVCGRATCQKVLRRLEELLRERAPVYLSPYVLLAQDTLGGDDYVLLVGAAQREAELTAAALAEGALALRRGLEEELAEEFASTLPDRLRLHVGFAVLTLAGRNAEADIYTALKEAFHLAKAGPDPEKIRHLADFKDILARGAISTLYQPVVDLKTGAVFGYEALTRGPADSYFATPLRLFSFAEEEGLTYPLEKLARERAIRNLGALPPGVKLFLNINPRIMNDPDFSPGQTRELIADQGLTPRSVVFELTERTAIRDFAAFRKALQHYRNQGFLVAIDDTGAGYSSLQAIAELAPDYIKIDRSLIHGLEGNPVKRALVETFVTLAGKINSRLIAEGLETAAELTALAELGVEYAQGFFLARPGFPPPALSQEAVESLRSLRRGTLTPKGGPRVGDCKETCRTVSPEILTREVAAYFENTPAARAVVVIKDGQPQGLVMRDKLFHQLSRQYGYSLFMPRPVEQVMDAHPLIVEEDMPLDQVSRLAMARDADKLYDHILVTRRGVFVGVLSVQQLLTVLMRTQVEVARFANPLTGLPGNARIEQELASRLEEGLPMGVIYADLDCFKAFNDRYGFQRGDQAIKLLTEILTSTVSRLGGPDDFVGHIGGDDFVVITSPERAEDIARAVIATFDAEVGRLYDMEDRQRGYITTCDRRGRVVRMPLLTVSLAVIDTGQRRFTSVLELAEAAAELKAYAKGMKGSAFVRERRRTPPVAGEVACSAENSSPQPMEKEGKKNWNGESVN